jgi:formylglycine-generating enzyme required for sulfatase activity
VMCFFMGLLAQPGFAQSRPGLSLQIVGGHAQLRLTGDIGCPCAVQYSTNLSSNTGWTSLTNVTLLSNPTVIIDSGAITNGPRFYQVVITGPSNGVWIPAGTFVMGSPTNELLRNTNETQHSVTLTKGFYVSQYLVTQGDYQTLMNTNPSYYTPTHAYTMDLTRPVEQVSWFDATNYCNLLTQQERAAGHIFTNWLYRLPTEAEWEYASRAGSTNAFCYGPDLLSGMANFYGEYQYVSGVGTVTNFSAPFLDRTSSVGSYLPNAFGIYDVVGNVWEWCQDWYGSYGTGAVIDPQGPGTGTTRVFRGGALNQIGKDCRSARRDSYDPSVSFNTVGFRVVLAPGP